MKIADLNFNVFKVDFFEILKTLFKNYHIVFSNSDSEQGDEIEISNHNDVDYDKKFTSIFFKSGFITSEEMLIGVRTPQEDHPLFFRVKNIDLDNNECIEAIK